MTNNIEWAQNKAQSLLADQVKQLEKSAYPDEKELRGMVQMAYACDLINTMQLDYWHQKVTQAVADRRAVLRVERQQQMDKECKAVPTPRGEE